MSMAITRRRDVVARAAWIAVAAWVLIYAPMAFEFMSRYFFHGPELWDHAYSGLVGDRQALGAGSIHAVQLDHYRDNASAMVTHTLLGASAVALCVFQLSRFSRRRLAIHRRLGRVLVGAVTVSMLAALVFLLSVGPDGTYDGPAFNLQLWGLALGTLLGGWIGFVAIRKRQVATHRIMMSYMFALLCTAPFLRLGYLAFGLAWPTNTQEVSNLAGAGILGFLAPSAVVFAARFVRAPGSTANRDNPFTRRTEVLLATIGAVGLIALVWRYATAFSAIDRITVCWLATAAIAASAAVYRRLHAADATARHDWAVYLVAIEMAAPLTLALWAIYRQAFGLEASFYGALLTGPPATISAGVLAIAASRWRPTPTN